MRWEEDTEEVGIAANQQVAEKYVEELKKKYPDAYTHGKFFYTEFDFITK
jgi:hypothetical protein